MNDRMVLVDSSVWIDAFRARRTDAGAEVEILLREERAVITEPVLLEIGVGNGNPDRLKELLSELRLLLKAPVSRAVWFDALENADRLCRNGVHVPATDLLLASVALAYDLELLHNDGHFEMMAEVLPLRQRRAGPPA